MSVKHLDHVNLSVRNLEESERWYGELFGFVRVEAGVRDGRPWAILQSGEALLCLYESPEREFLDPDGLADREVHGVNHFSFRIAEGRAWEDRAHTLGVSILYGGAYRYPHSTSWYVLDPTGYEIEVVAWDADEVRFG